MAALDEIPSDEELTQATKDGTIREGTARIHYKLFTKYGFLIPENPLYHGETIFFGLTAHVDASRKYIADLREEIYPDQRVKFMAVPVERDGTVKWKALVVGPLPLEEQDVMKMPGNEDLTNQTWVTCKVHPNIQSTHGFATPDGGNQYHDNVYFSLKEATDGLGKPIHDLTAVFSPGETIKALVVPADSRFKAKYRAVKVCKVPANEHNEMVTPESDVKGCSLVEEVDQSAVSWIYNILKTKGSVKLTSMAGDLSHNAAVRAVVQPQKKSIKRFIAKYQTFFAINDDVVSLTPDCPPLQLKTKDADFNDHLVNAGDYDGGQNWSDDDSTADEASSSESSHSTTPHTTFSKQRLKSVADFSSIFTMSMLADLIKLYPEPMKMSELFKVCQKHGWEGIQSVAMVAQVVSNNPKYFGMDDKSCVKLTPEGMKLSVKQTDETVTLKAVGNAPSSAMPPVKSAINFTDPTITRGSQGSPMFTASNAMFPAFSVNATKNSYPDSIDAINTLGFSQQTHEYALASNGVSRRAYTPVGPTLSSSVQMKTYTGLNNSFPTSSVLTGTNGGLGPRLEVYNSDTEDSFEEKFHGKQTQHYTEEEGRYLSVVARGICQNAIGGREEVFNLLKKELEGIGVMQADTEGTSGTLSRHLRCIQLDVGKKPRAKFQVFTPSGKISQTTLSLTAEKVSETGLAAMLSEVNKHASTVRVGRLLYGIDKSYHCIRMMTNGLDEVSGCTVSFRIREAPDVRMSDLLELGERGKVRIIFSDVTKGTSSSAACESLRKFAEEKSANAMVVVVDMEGQIFGFGQPSCEARRMICGSLDMQQRHLKEAVHHQPNFVVANSVDCRETLSLLKRIYDRGISIYAEVPKSLEANVRKIFEIKMK